ncbi:MAG: hypothetical protein ACFCBW_06385 [Candidatus Competibacterales bacterium]
MSNQTQYLLQALVALEEALDTIDHSDDSVELLDGALVASDALDAIDAIIGGTRVLGVDDKDLIAA